MRRLVALLVLALLVTGCSSSEPKSPASPGRSAERALRGAPGPLGRLHAEANRLLDGGPAGFRSRLAELRGYPVVVNKWASWCGPCRAEFPFFQKQALARGKRVAFLGVDGNDNDGDAKAFLRQFPVSYPSYRDPNLKISAAFKAVGFPATAFYDSQGELAFVHQGGYATERTLAEDVARYAR
jgi:cytochrome c biogenesis protein CcmG, thiol:disulfide interchange protein DsbE